MKKTFTLAMLLLVAVSCAFGQYRPKKMPHHRSGGSRGSSSAQSEISVGVGYMSTGQLVNIIESAKQAHDNFNNPMGNEEMNTNLAVFGPTFTVQYLYGLSEHLYLGAGVVYQQATGMQAVLSDMSGSENNYVFAGKYLTFMPTLKLYWFNREHFGMYSKLAVGGTYRMENVNGVSDNSFMFNGQLSAFCLEFGGEHFRAFLESGFGASGSGFGGLKYTF